MRVLFVDDDDVTLFLYKVLVKAFPSCTAFFARDGKEALSILEAEELPVNMMFLDINMPVMDGFELLRNHEQLPDDKRAERLYIMLGTDISEERRSKLFNFTNVKDCLQKPLRQEVFASLMAQIPG
ncbi:MAG: response regulator [Bacteroidota bacterium]